MEVDGVVAEVNDDTLLYQNLKWIRIVPATSTSKQEMIEHLMWYGEDAWNDTHFKEPVMVNVQPQNSGYPNAFIAFDDQSQAQTLVNKLQKNESKLTVSIETVSLPFDQRNDEYRGHTSTVMLHYIHPKVTAEDIRRVCNQYGTFVELKWNYIARNTPLRNVMVRMSSTEEASAVVDGLHGYSDNSLHSNGSIPLQTSFIITGQERLRLEQKRLHQEKRAAAMLKKNLMKEDKRAVEIVKLRKQCGLLEDVTDGDWERYFERAQKHGLAQQEMEREKRMEMEKREEEMRQEQVLMEAQRIRKAEEEKAKLERERVKKEKLREMRTTLLGMRCARCQGVGHTQLTCLAPRDNKRLRSYVPLSVADLEDDDIVKEAWSRYKRAEKRRQRYEERSRRKNQKKKEKQDNPLDPEAMRRARLYDLRRAKASGKLNNRRENVSFQPRPQESFGIKFA